MRAKKNQQDFPSLKWVWIIFILLVAAAIFSPAFVRNNGTPTQIPTQTASQTIYTLGDKVVTGNFAYTFFAKTTETVIYGTFSDKTALGTFMIFDLEIENIGTEPAYLWNPPIKIVDDRERKYERDSGAELQLAMSDSNVKVLASIDKLQPNLPKRVKIVFDVPKDVLQNRNGLIEISKESILTDEKKYVSWSADNAVISIQDVGKSGEGTYISSPSVQITNTGTSDLTDMALDITLLKGGQIVKKDVGVPLESGDRSENMKPGYHPYNPISRVPAGNSVIGTLSYLYPMDLKNALKGHYTLKIDLRERLSITVIATDSKDFDVP